MSSSNSRLVSGVSHLLDNDRFSDLKIKCEDHLISAHKLVVCTPSDVLHAMCTAGFQESESNIIDLSHDTKRVVYRMVEFLYCGDYQELDHPDYQTIDKDLVDRTGIHHAVLHADIFAVADKYDIAALGNIAKNKFEEAINKKGFGDPDHLRVIKYVYSTTPESNRGLRDVIVSHTQARGNKIRTNFVLNSRLEEIVSTTPQFGWDLIQSSLLSASIKRCSECKTELGVRTSCTECITKEPILARKPSDSFGTDPNWTFFGGNPAASTNAIPITSRPLKPNPFPSVSSHNTAYPASGGFNGLFYGGNLANLPNDYF
ncbi:MAG: hypothetical protein ALECFALPRED_007482 [Alectoria fallacina]|uniref:BTB domain-containing protein n=1 Tax=Alectoria fallacina TaxID=1903189 RepID=A0A8H3G718_9LECA|nr:MAG: hypothetical protein ALECFALPRED_007482 [Alectoria fallacina]